MLDLFSDAKNIFIAILIAAIIILYALLELAYHKADALELSNNLLMQQSAEYTANTDKLKQLADKEEVELHAAEKRADEIRAKGNAKTNNIMLQKVSSDCIQSKDWLIDYALELKGAA